MRNAGLFSALREDKRALGVFCGGAFGRACCIDRQGVALGSTLDWFDETSRRVEERNDGYASLVFMHKAMPEFRDMWENGGCRGVRYEREGCALVNPGLFCALLEDGTVRGVFVGHDHGNNYTGAYHGIRLSYGAITGYNNFARNGLCKDLPRGARAIVLDRRGEFHSYFYFADNRRRDEDMCLIE